MCEGGSECVCVCEREPALCSGAGPARRQDPPRSLAGTGSRSPLAYAAALLGQDRMLWSPQNNGNQGGTREAVATRVEWEIGLEWGGGGQGLGCLQGEETSEMLQDTEGGGGALPHVPGDVLGDQFRMCPPGTDLPLCQPGLSLLSYLLGSSAWALTANPGPQPWESAFLGSVSRNPAHLGRCGWCILCEKPSQSWHKGFLPRGPSCLFLRT